MTWATSRYAAGLRHYHAVGNRLGVANCVQGFAGFAALRCDWPTATRLFGHADASHAAIGAPLAPRARADYLPPHDATREALGADFDAAWAAGAALAADAGIALTLALAPALPD